MNKSFKILSKTDLTKLALMAIASSVILVNPLSADDDYRSSARNRRYSPDQYSDNNANPNADSTDVYPNQNPNGSYKNQNGSYQNQNPKYYQAQNTNVTPYNNQNNPYQSQSQYNQTQTPGNPYQNQSMNPSMNPDMNPNINSMNPSMNPSANPSQTPGNMNAAPGKFAGNGCKGNGKCQGTTYPDQNSSNNGRVVADNGDMNTLNNNNNRNKDMLDKDSDKDTLNNYNVDTQPKDNNTDNNSWNGKAKPQTYQQNNNLRQNRLSL